MTKTQIKNVKEHIAYVFSTGTKPKHKGTITTLYNNDGYKYCWDASAKVFAVISPAGNILFVSKNPVKAHTQYEIYTALAFRRRIKASGYTAAGDKYELI